MTDVKICGLTTPETLTAAIEAGARYVGFVFYSKSPRNIDLDIAGYLARYIPTSVHSVGLFVNPSDEDLDHALSKVGLDIIQLHGTESPDRIKEIKTKYGLKIIKAIPLATKEDINKAAPYDSIADFIMFDAKPIEGADLPGGNGLSFDWSILQGYTSLKPWFLAGGLTPENVNEAIERTNPPILDVSSGVESAPGQKDNAKIQAFLNAVKQA